MSVGAHRGRAPDTRWRAIAAALLPALMRLSLLLICGPGLLVLGCIALAACFHAAGRLTPAEIGTALTALLWLWVAGLGGFALFVATDLVVDRR